MSAELRAVYLDASALVKLVLPESESGALASTLAPVPEVVTSVLGAIELRRAVALATSGNQADLTRADALLEAVTVVAITDPIRALAASLEPFRLRTLDAVHLATALILRPRVEGFVAYDRRLVQAAREAGLRVLAPGSA